MNNDIGIRKATLKIEKVNETANSIDYKLMFHFDALSPVTITVYAFVLEITEFFTELT